MSDGAVVVVLEEDAEAGRRLGQPVDLFLERDDLVARLAQRRRQPLVLGARGGELGLLAARRSSSARWAASSRGPSPAVSFSVPGTVLTSRFTHTGYTFADGNFDPIGVWLERYSTGEFDAASVSGTVTRS